MTDYIKSIRKLVGHAPLITAGAGILLINSNNEILLQRRRDNGMWALHGGAVEFCECVEDAARRELFEETGLLAHSIELFGVFSGLELHYIYPNGDEVSIISVIYICRDWEGVPVPQLEEVSELRFFLINSLPEDISPPDKSVLQKLSSEFGI